MFNNDQQTDLKRVYFSFIWHGFFLALTMAMIEMNTVLPSLISRLTDNTISFGVVYSIMLGAPLIFNLPFSRYLQRFAFKRKFLLAGIYLRGLSFLAMAAVTFLLAGDNPRIALGGFYFLILIFATSGGLAGMSYADLVGKLLPQGKRGELYAAKQIVAGIASLLGGFFVAWVFQSNAFTFPNNYALSLLVGFGGLTLAASGFWLIKEPPSPIAADNGNKDNGFLRDVVTILKRDKKFMKFIIVENATSFSLMILPFYLVFVQTSFPDYERYLGAFVIAQTVGSISSNFMWAYISKKYGAERLVGVCILIGASIPPVALLLRPGRAVFYVLVFFLVGLIRSGRSLGFETYLLDLAPAQNRTMYLGIRGTMNFLVVLLPIAGGLFIRYLGFYVSFILVSAIMIMAFFFNRRKA